jgi:CRISPR-associated protein Csx10
VSGWNIAHGLPRPDDLAIVAGSVAVFSAPRGSRNVVIDCLKLVEARGIGERIQEGFGRVIVSHPFHLQEEWL